MAIDVFTESAYLDLLPVEQHFTSIGFLVGHLPVSFAMAWTDDRCRATTDWLISLRLLHKSSVPFGASPSILLKPCKP